MPAKVNLQDDRAFVVAMCQHIVEIVARIKPAESDEAQTILHCQRPYALPWLAHYAVEPRLRNRGCFLRQCPLRRTATRVIPERPKVYESSECRHHDLELWDGDRLREAV